MKLATGKVQAFLRNPDTCRVVLLFGEDAGMIRDRAEMLVRAVAGSLDDPFLVSDLQREDIRRLPDEAAGRLGTPGSLPSRNLVLTSMPAADIAWLKFVDRERFARNRRRCGNRSRYHSADHSSNRSGTPHRGPR